MAYIMDFKKYNKDLEKKMGANPTKIEEDEGALLTDPKLVATEDQIRNLEKQLEVAKQQRETIIKDLRTKAAAEKQKQANAPVTTPQTAQPASQTTGV